MKDPVGTASWDTEVYEMQTPAFGTFCPQFSVAVWAFFFVPSGASPFVWTGMRIWHALRRPAKAFLCKQWARNGLRNCVRFLVVFIHTEGCGVSSLFPCIIHGTSSFKTIAGHLSEGRRAVIISALVVGSNIFLDQCYELCLIPRDFAI